jgi:cobalt-zinc-cadmium efflux system membrane fusion protein
MSTPSLFNTSRWNVALILLGLVAAGLAAFVAGRSVGDRADMPPSVQASEAHPEGKQVVHSHEHSHAEAGESGLITFTPESLQQANLRIESAREMRLPARLAVTGVVEPNPSGLVKVTSRAEGRVLRLLATVGDTVTAGQTLAVIESEKLHLAQIAHRLAVKKVALARKTLEQRRRLAALGAFGQPALEEARQLLTEREGAVRHAETEIAAAQATIAETEALRRTRRATLEQTRTRLATARRRAERAEMLYREELLSRQDWEAAQAEVALSETEVSAAQAALSEVEAALARAQAKLRAADTALSTARQQQAIARQALRRAEAVYKGRYLTSREVAEAETAYAQAQIEEAGALDDVELLGGKPGDLHEIPVQVPISGRVTERSVTLGETVSAERPLFTVLNTETVWAQLNLFQSDLGRVRVGQPVVVTADTAPGIAFRGIISYIGEVVDETSRAVKVRCVIQNSGGKLKPGVFVSGVILETSGRAEKVVVVPQDAVQELNGQTVVFVPTEHEGEFKAQPVETGEPVDGRIPIRSGLKPGDRLVTGNAFTVKARAVMSESAADGHGH